MLFNNLQILKTNADMKIGSIDTNKNELSFNNYCLELEMKILSMISNSVKTNMAYGMNREDAIKSLVTYIYSFLDIVEKSYPTDEEGVLQEILKSREYKDWNYSIWYSFKNTHLGRVDKDTPIECFGETNPEISDDILQLIMEDNSLQVVVSGLSSLNFND